MKIEQLKEFSPKESVNNIFPNICFIGIVSVHLLMANPFLYIEALEVLANENNLNIYEVNDNEKAMVLLCDSIYKN